MTLASALTSIEQIQSVLARMEGIPPPLSPAAPSPARTSTGDTFDAALNQAMAPAAASRGIAPLGAVTPPAGSFAQRMVTIAEGEVGQAEQPPGSNDSARITQYRKAVAGAPGPGPWCAYFASWVARQAGVPLAPNGQGSGSIDELWSWARQTGHAVAAGSPPQPGDLIVLPEHIGIVTAILPNGQLQTVEGNYSDKVSQNTRTVSEALGFIRPGG